MNSAFTLPEGRLGQALAIALPLLAAALLWIAVLSPLLGWYQAGAAQLEQQQDIAAHMAALGQEIPALRKAVRAAGLESDNQALLTGGTEALAGANMQSALQNLATQAGTSLDSAELLPVQQAGSLRRIGMQVSVTATWPVLIALLEAIGTAHPSMVVDNLSVINSAQPDGDQAQPVQANFSVAGFWAGTP